MNRINIIGAGLAGLSAALTIAKAGKGCRLISPMSSERAQSVMAEGGINAALNTMGEDDTPQEHYADTMKGGVYLADPNAVYRLCTEAPATVSELCNLGAALRMQKNGPVLRNFGGQKKKRTAYAKSSTGKILMTALTDAVRRYEVQGLIERYTHHRMEELCISGETCTGVKVLDLYSGDRLLCSGPVILACGGMNSLFPGLTTGTVVNTGDAAAAAFCQGVALANLEFIQYHPTTAAIAGKRCLISEAARGEGGRLYVLKNAKPWYFMEEKYPEYGNLMPRDVVSREMELVRHLPECSDTVYLDMTELQQEVWKTKLTDLREECMELLGKDPSTEALEVSPGIHYFMGGIYVDEQHRCSKRSLYAAGECACQYHGANRLGGNSMLGAVYGGKRAAMTAMEELTDARENAVDIISRGSGPCFVEPTVQEEAAVILRNALGIFRTGEQLTEALDKLKELTNKEQCTYQKKRLILGQAVLMSALNRCESRGAHTRTDFPDKNDSVFRKTSKIVFDGEKIAVSLEEIPVRRGENA